MTDLLDLLTVFGTCAEAESEPELGEWSCGDPFEYQDYDYATVQIGEQCWFAENLRAMSFQSGNSMDSVENLANWHEPQPHWAVYGQGYDFDDSWEMCYNFSPTIDACDPAESLNEYGLLYNGHAVLNDQQLCPSGWHLPAIAEYEQLNNALGQGAASYLSLKSDSGWPSWNGMVGTNESGFNALPGGSFPEGSMSAAFAGEFGVWGTSSSLNADEYFAIEISIFSSEVIFRTAQMWQGVSVRCIKDSE